MFLIVKTTCLIVGNVTYYTTHHLISTGPLEGYMHSYMNTEIASGEDIHILEGLQTAGQANLAGG